MVKLPPLGLTPRFIVVEQRVDDINRAITLEDGNVKWTKVTTTYAQKAGSKVKKSNLKFHSPKSPSRTLQDFLDNI